MSKLLLNLRHVPEDEADEVRELLREHAIAFYETRPGNWGFSAGGIWISEAADYPEARRLMDAYQAQRRERVRAEVAAARREGRAPTLWTVLREEPLRVLATLLGIAAIIALTTAVPYLLLRG
ncbi:DUF6164 family protein [Rehaibacterium terrae]|jgi:hypothetical protein|uniref:Transmembrane protein n=1 Tax=Rehaibacterium terrae TaxID=1341696 RepID=A0A7W8DF12_9GAMM|nr:DUF6164 family protein [Rehaibacterium terrae]MBB5015990.1 hypothetical protein [Rehaibacterium terrae]